jgi:hypothetical protein
MLLQPLSMYIVMSLLIIIVAVIDIVIVSVIVIIVVAIVVNFVVAVLKEGKLFAVIVVSNSGIICDFCNCRKNCSAI